MRSMASGAPRRHGFEYYRHGTLSLYAALDALSGDVFGQTARRHTSEEFVAFLSDHPNVRFHFTPTHSSWLNQIEIWFAKIERDVIARGVFTSTADLRRKLMWYIRRDNRNARPIRLSECPTAHWKHLRTATICEGKHVMDGQALMRSDLRVPA
jgi:transposase